MLEPLTITVVVNIGCNKRSYRDIELIKDHLIPRKAKFIGNSVVVVINFSDVSVLIKRNWPHLINIIRNAFSMIKVSRVSAEELVPVPEVNSRIRVMDVWPDFSKS